MGGATGGGATSGVARGAVGGAVDTAIGGGLLKPNPIELVAVVVFAIVRFAGAMNRFVVVVVVLVNRLLTVCLGAYWNKVEAVVGGAADDAVLSPVALPVGWLGP